MNLYKCLTNFISRNEFESFIDEYKEYLNDLVVLNDDFINTNFEIFGGDYTFFEAILIVIFTIIHLEKNDLCLIIFSSCDIPGDITSHIQKIVNYQKDKTQRYINICHNSFENWSILPNSIEYIPTISDKNLGFDINWKNIIEFRKFEKEKKIVINQLDFEHYLNFFNLAYKLIHKNKNIVTKNEFENLLNPMALESDKPVNSSGFQFFSWKTFTIGGVFYQFLMKGADITTGVATDIVDKSKEMSLNLLDLFKKVDFLNILIKNIKLVEIDEQIKNILNKSWLVEFIKEDHENYKKISKILEKYNAEYRNSNKIHKKKIFYNNKLKHFIKEVDNDKFFTILLDKEKLDESITALEKTLKEVGKKISEKNTLNYELNESKIKYTSKIAKKAMELLPTFDSNNQFVNNYKKLNEYIITLNNLSGTPQFDEIDLQKTEILSTTIYKDIENLDENLKIIAVQNVVSQIPGLLGPIATVGTIGMSSVNDVVTQVSSLPNASIINIDSVALGLLGLTLLGITLFSATIIYFLKTVVKVEKEKYIRDINSIPKPFLRKILGNTGLFGEYGELARCGKCIENTCIDEDGEEWCEVLEKPDFKSGGCSIDDYKSETRWLGFGGTKHKIRCQMSTKKARELLYESPINMENFVNKLREEGQRIVKRRREEAESSESDGDTKTNKKQRLVEIEPDNFVNIAKEKRQRGESGGSQNGTHSKKDKVSQSDNKTKSKKQRI